MPRTAGQSVLVMAAVSVDEVVQREDLRDERDAQVGIRAGVTVRRPSQALIRCECAFTNMNVDSGKNLTGVLMPNVNGAARPATVAGALHDDTHGARFYRTTVTCIWA